MKPSIIKSKDELPMFMSVMDLIDLLGISRSSAYELAAEEGFPKLKLVPGRIIIPRDKLLEWLDEHTSYMAGWGEVKDFSIGKQVKAAPLYGVGISHRTAEPTEFARFQELWQAFERCTVIGQRSLFRSKVTLFGLLCHFLRKNGGFGRFSRVWSMTLTESMR